MNYQSKYLKYKIKYLKLKEQIGGMTLPEFLLESERVSNLINTNLKTTSTYSKVCPQNYYNFTGLDLERLDRICTNDISCVALTFQKVRDSDIDEMNKGILNDMIGMIDNVSGFIKPRCQRIWNAEYFDNSLRWDNLSNISDVNKIIDFNIDNYENAISLFDNKYYENKHMICLEGNLIYADTSSNIISGGITSCLFIVIYFDDGSKICAHLNVMLSNLMINDKKILDYNDKSSYTLTHNNIFKFIKDKYSDKLNNIKSIYICGIIESYSISLNNSFDLAGIMDGPIYDFDNTLKNVRELDIKKFIKTRLGLSVDKDFNLCIHDAGESGLYMVSNNTVYKKA